MAGNQTKGVIRRFKQNASCVCCVSRRDLLSGFAAVAAGAALPIVTASAQAPATKTPAAKSPARQRPAPAGSTCIGILFHQDILSIPGAPIATTAPPFRASSKTWIAVAFRCRSCRSARRHSPHPDAAQAAKFSRMSNEYSAKLCTEHPGRFGHFAYLPLPDIDASLKEIDYALGTLKADGVFLMTNYGNTFLGDPAFEPVFQELNRRRAVVYTHPDRPSLLREPGAGPARRRHRIRHQHHARDRQIRVQRQLAALSGYPRDLVARRRHHAVPDPPLRQAGEGEPGISAGPA